MSRSSSPRSRNVPHGATILLLSAAVAAPLTAQERVNVDGLGRLPAFSHATVVGETVYVAGTLGTAPGELAVVSGGVGAETRQALRNVGAILEAAGSSLREVAKCTVYLIDMAGFEAMNRVWSSVFGDAPPARTTVGVAELALGAAVEIDCIGVRVAEPESAAESAAESVPGFPLESGFFEHEGESLYYETVGVGETVVLSHGLGGNHAIWFQQVPALARSFRVVTWDQRGFGRSTDRAGEAGPAAFARDLGALLDHLGVERAHLVGQSMGGWTVLGFALAHPERVESLVLADTLGGLTTAAIDRHWQRLASAPSPAIEELPFYRHPAVGERLAERDPARAFLYRQLSSLSPPAPPSIPLQLASTRHRDGLARLALPVLFVVGSDDDIFPPALVREAAAQLPSATVVEIEESGHSPYFERPEAWNRVVVDFLAGGRAGSDPDRR